MVHCNFSPALGAQISVGASSKRVFFHCFPSSELGNESVEIWTNASGDWLAVPFAAQQSHFISDAPYLRACVDLQPLTGYVQSFEFTYRIKRPDGSIEWLGAAGVNGVVRHFEGVPLPNSIETVLTGTDSAVQASTSSKTTAADSPKAQLLSYVLSDSTGPTEIDSVGLGVPHGSPLSRALVLERTKAWWHTSRCLTNLSELSSQHDTQLLLFQSDDPTITYAILPLSTHLATATLRGAFSHEEPKIWLRCERGIESAHQATAHCVVGWAREWDLEQLMDVMVQLGREAVAKANAALADEDDVPMPVANNTKGGPTDGLTWCSWNALGKPYSLSGVIDAFGSLNKATKGAKGFESILLDDGWQAKDDQDRLTSFGAREGWLDVDMTLEDVAAMNPAGMRRSDSGFAPSRPISQNCSDMGDDPMGPLSSMPGVSDLTSGLSLLRTRFPSVQRIGIWLTLQGYWQGLAANSPVAERYSVEEYAKRDILKGNPDGHYLLPSVDSLSDFWHDYFSCLKAAGVDYVKLDNIASHDALTGVEGAVLKARAHGMAVEAAEAVFGKQSVIHCMAMGPRLLAGEFGLGVNKQGTGEIVRTYDDYIPHADESHRVLVLNNTSMTILTKALSFLPDFDMFQTDHPFAAYHAAFRVFSPSPIFITDKNSHDAEILDRLMAPRKGASAAAVQSQNNQKPIRLSNTVFIDNASTSAGPATKIGVRVRNHGALLGLWNCRADQNLAIDTLTKSDVASILPSSLPAGAISWTLYSFRNKSVITGLQLAINEERSLDATASDVITPIILPYKGFDVITIAPMFRLGTSQDAATVACLGLADKYGGLCAIASVSVVQYVQPPAPATPINEATTVEPETPRAASPAPSSHSVVLDELESHRQIQGKEALSTRFFRAPLQTIAAGLRKLASLLWLVVSLRWLQSREDLRALSSPGQEIDERTPLMRDLSSEPAHMPTLAFTPVQTTTVAALKQTAPIYALEVQIGSAGNLAFVLPAAASQKKASYSVTIDGVEAPAEAIYLRASAECVLVTLDMLQATKIMADGSNAVEECWTVQLRIL